jgi:hypothetical protein
MSVSAFNQPLAHSTHNATPPEADAKGNTGASAVSSRGQPSAGISFRSRENQSGPLFGSLTSRLNPGHCHPGSPPRPSPGHCHAGPPPRPNPGNCRPDPCPPPRPTPIRPDPHYSKQSNEQLAQKFLDNFEAFKDPRNPRYITQKSLEDMAGKQLTGDPATDQNIRLAREILRRPELKQALDREGCTGALDGRFSRQDIRSVVHSDNPLKYHDDKQLAQLMLEHFDELKGGFWKGSLKIKNLERLAALPLTGNARQDPLIQLAREITQRSDVLKKMDNLGSRDRDGKIHKDALRWLSR